jgi:hypothetical protein
LPSWSNRMSSSASKISSLTFEDVLLGSGSSFVPLSDYSTRA